MAKWIEWTTEQEAAWAEWLSARPQAIQDIVAKYNLRPDNLYQLKETGQIGYIHSLNERGTLTMDFTDTFNQHNLYMSNRRVFGLNPEDLEECDLPEGVEVIKSEPTRVH